MNASENYHEYWHFLFGLLASFIVIKGYPAQPVLPIVIVGLIMSILPDIDHILYFYVYGRNTKYSKKVRKLIKNSGISKAIKYCKKEHKNNTSIYSHNLVMIFALLFFTKFLIIQNYNALIVVAVLSWAMHYIYDIFEDLLFFGKLNPNWFLLFNQKR